MIKKLGLLLVLTVFLTSSLFAIEFHVVNDDTGEYVDEYKMFVMETHIPYNTKDIDIRYYKNDMGGIMDLGMEDKDYIVGIMSKDHETVVRRVNLSGNQRDYYEDNGIEIKMYTRDLNSSTRESTVFFAVYDAKTRRLIQDVNNDNMFTGPRIGIGNEGTNFTGEGISWKNLLPDKYTYRLGFHPDSGYLGTVYNDIDFSHQYYSIILERIDWDQNTRTAMKSTYKLFDYDDLLYEHGADIHHIDFLTLYDGKLNCLQGLIDQLDCNTRDSFYKLSREPMNEEQFANSSFKFYKSFLYNIYLNKYKTEIDNAEQNLETCNIFEQADLDYNLLISDTPALDSSMLEVLDDTTIVATDEVSSKSFKCTDCKKVEIEDDKVIATVESDGEDKKIDITSATKAARESEDKDLEIVVKDNVQVREKPSFKNLWGITGLKTVGNFGLTFVN